MANESGKYRVKLTRGPFVKLPVHVHSATGVDELPAVVARLGRPLAVDLFCGAGGLSLGLSEAGFDVVLGVDHDDFALDTHRAYHPGLSVNWDLGDATVVDRVATLVQESGIVLLAGGPPCQPFSRAGRSMMRELVRRGLRPKHDARRDLWESFLTIIEKARPQAVLMENVPDMALDRGMVILRTMVERLEAIGYSVEERVVTTSDYGVPQMRQRLILVALRDGIQFVWPEPTGESVSLVGAIGDLPEVEGGWRPSNGDGADVVATGWAEYGGPRTEFQRRLRRHVATENSGRIYDHITRPVREDDALAFAQMTHETKYSDLDPELRRYRDDIFDDKYKRLNPDDFSRTITAHIAKDGYWYIHPFQDRTLTVREAARIQTFPDHVRFAGPPSAAFRQIGNAVPPLVGEHLGEAILVSIQAGAKAPHSTQEIAGALARWFDAVGPTAAPWLAATNRWQVIQALLLWDRLSDRLICRAWKVTEKLLTPEQTLGAIPALRAFADSVGRGERCGLLAEAAEFFVANPIALHADSPVDLLQQAPHVSAAIADLACRVIPGEYDDPVLVGSGVVRVAARFHGDMSDRRNKMTDGRLAVAKMIGGGDTSHSAHLALIELAAGVCTPAEPRCGSCPLQQWCEASKDLEFQLTIPAT